VNRPTKDAVKALVADLRLKSRVECPEITAAEAGALAQVLEALAEEDEHWLWLCLRCGKELDEEEASTTLF